MRFPVGSAFNFSVTNGSIGNLGIGTQAFIEGGKVNEGFEDRADLATSLYGAVEFGFIRISTTYECEDTTCLVLDKYGGTLNIFWVFALLEWNTLPSGACLVWVTGNTFGFA